VKNKEVKILYYQQIKNEKTVFNTAFQSQHAVLLKGPTGCGKTRFVESMAEELGRPLITVSCHEDLTAADLLGRFLLKGGETVWIDGPLTRAVREGAICYLDEVVEARSDTTVAIHALTDHRRELFIERLNEKLIAPKDFMLVVSYNPGYQSILKDLKPSTRQRMVSISFDFPLPELEREILVNESGIKTDLAEDIVKLASALRKLDIPGVPEVCSTRTLITAADLIVKGMSPVSAVEAAIIEPLCDDIAIVSSLMDVAKNYLNDVKVELVS